MKTPESSQAPDLIRIVSWIRVCWLKFLFAIVIVCLLSRATWAPSELQTTYLTGGELSSARVFCCWMSKSTTEDVEDRMRLAVPP